MKYCFPLFIWYYNIFTELSGARTVNKFNTVPAIKDLMVQWGVYNKSKNIHANMCLCVCVCIH